MKIKHELKSSKGMVSKFFLSLFLLINSYSCTKFADTLVPADQVVSEAVFTSDRSATTTVVGLYSIMMQTNLFMDNGGLSVYTSLSADELVNNPTTTNLVPFFANTLPVDQNIVQANFWASAYKYIYQANACIEGINGSTQISAAVKSQLLGEVKFIRALNYFNLVNLFGDVPLELSTNYRVNEIMPRTAALDVYKQIVADLIDAQSLLTVAYPTAGAVRANKWAATALLARVYLYQKDWADAEAMATSVINSGTYSLVANLNNVFLAGSTEAILQLIPVNAANSAEGNAFIPTSATIIPPYYLNTPLLNAFEANDQRKTAWLSKNTVSGVSYYYPYKYKVMTGTTKTEDNMVLRLAEQYLIRAEARAQQNNLSGSNSAASDINLIRARSGLGSITSTSQTAILLAVEKERQTELFTECGHRWFDLKRTSRIDAVLSVGKSGWLPAAALYPIPLIEIQNNPFLKQNPGY